MKQFTKFKWRYKKLPSNLSGLILIALKDLRAVEKDKRFAVNMQKWFEDRPTCDGTSNHVCHVCLAGSVIAKSCQIPPDTQLVFVDDFDGYVNDRFSALDYIRNGYIQRAFELINPNKTIPGKMLKLIDEKIEKLNSLWVKYERDSKIFKRNLHKIAKILEKYGF